MPREKDIAQLIYEHCVERGLRLQEPSGDVNGVYSLRRGYARIEVTREGVSGRREGDPGERGDRLHFLHKSCPIPVLVPWAADILATGRTLECGPGVGLRPMQNAVYVDYQGADYPMAYLPAIVRAEGRDDEPWDLDPDYQRGHVWSREQREAYVGYHLIAQRTPLVFVNSGPSGLDRYEVVDGKQRITSLLMFIDGEIEAVTPDGQRLRWEDFDEVDQRCAPNLKCGILRLGTREQVLRFYLGLNAGGTVHKPEEIERVRELLAAEGRGV